MENSTLKILLAVACVAIAPAVTCGGEVAGAVVDSNGKPISGVTVIVQSSAASAPDIPPESRVVTTAADGSFRTAVAGGDYIICADAWAAGLLNPCEWGSSVPVRVTANQTIGNIRLELAPGARLDFRVSDPGKLRPKPEEGHPDTFAVPCVVDSTDRIRCARWMGTDAEGHVFQLLVPDEEDYEVIVLWNNVVVTDGAGKAVGKDARWKLKPKRGNKYEYAFTMRAN